MQRPWGWEKSQGAVKKERSENDPGDAGSPPTQSLGKPGRLFGGVQLRLQYHSSCSSFYHFRLLFPYSLNHILISAITLLCTLSFSLQDSSICHKPGIPFHKSMVPTGLLTAKINLESLCVHLWITLKWNIVDLSFSCGMYVKRSCQPGQLCGAVPLLDPPTPPKRGLVV